MPTQYEFGDRFGISRRAVGKILTRHPDHAPRLTPAQIDEAVQLQVVGGR